MRPGKRRRTRRRDVESVYPAVLWPQPSPQRCRQRCRRRRCGTAHASGAGRQEGGGARAAIDVLVPGVVLEDEAQVGAGLAEGDGLVEEVGVERRRPLRPARGAARPPVVGGQRDRRRAIEARELPAEIRRAVADRALGPEQQRGLEAAVVQHARDVAAGRGDDLRQPQRARDGAGPRVEEALLADQRVEQELIDPEVARRRRGQIRPAARVRPAQDLDRGGGAIRLRDALEQVDGGRQA